MRNKVKKLLQTAEQCLILGDNRKAEVLSQQIIKTDPHNAEAYYFLGEALCKQRKFPESLDVLTKANTLLPNHPRIIHLLGWTVFMSGDADSGRKLMKRALKIIPHDVQMLCDLAVLEIQQGNGKEAKEYAVKANEIDPTNHLAQEVFMKVVAFDKERVRLIRKIN